MRGPVLLFYFLYPVPIVFCLLYLWGVLLFEEFRLLFARRPCPLFLLFCLCVFVFHEILTLHSCSCMCSRLAKCLPYRFVYLTAAVPTGSARKKKHFDTWTVWESIVGMPDSLWASPVEVIHFKNKSEYGRSFG